MNHQGPFNSNNWKQVSSQVVRATLEAGRKIEDVSLIAVSKTQKADKIVPVLQAGARVFGENRVLEAKDKWIDLKAQFPSVTLHLIGPLQSNKVREAVEIFDVIQTVDRPKIAQALAQECSRVGRMPSFMVEINIGEEHQKAGILPQDADAFIAQCRNQFGLTIGGLMCIPPHDQQAAPYFALMKKIANRNGIASLSMGMSDDFEIAIQMGATHVRVGTAIFGARASSIAP